MKKVVRLVGLEPTGPGFLARYGCQLHHKRGKFGGMPPGIRTQNIRILSPTRLTDCSRGTVKVVRVERLELSRSKNIGF